MATSDAQLPSRATLDTPGNGQAAADKQVLVIPRANMRVLELTLIGESPYVQERFAEKAIRAMAGKMEAGSTARKGQKREKRDWDADYKGAMHVTADGRYGIPAAAFRNAAIDACRTVGYHMTKAKMSVFILADDLDVADGSPLVYLEGEPEPLTMPTRNATGVADIRVRPQWREWRVQLRVRYDADQFTAQEVANLLERAGMSVGIGAGRPFSKNSNGLGWGTWRLADEAGAG